MTGVKLNYWCYIAVHSTVCKQMSYVESNYKGWIAVFKTC